MPINLDEALGAELDPIEFSWTSSDIQLYHLGLGAGCDPMDPRELRYLVDDTPQVLPTFGNVAASFHMTEPPSVKFPGIDIELCRVLHASEAVSVPGADPAVGHRPRGHQVHRHLGQGQGRGDLVGDHGHHAGRHAAVDAEAVDLRPRRGWLRRRARTVDLIGAAGAGARPRVVDPGVTAAGAAVPDVRGPQPAALRPGIRCGSRISASDPAWAVHVRHDLQGDGGQPARRRYRAGRQLRRPVRRRGVPRRDAEGEHLERGDGFQAVVTAPERDDAVALAGVELVPA